MNSGSALASTVFDLSTISFVLRERAAQGETWVVGFPPSCLSPRPKHSIEEQS